MAGSRRVAHTVAFPQHRAVAINEFALEHGEFLAGAVEMQGGAAPRFGLEEIVAVATSGLGADGVPGKAGFRPVETWVGLPVAGLPVDDPAAVEIPRLHHRLLFLLRAITHAISNMRLATLTKVMPTGS